MSADLRANVHGSAALALPARGALVDGLTGAGNRAALLLHLASALRQATRPTPSSSSSLPVRLAVQELIGATPEEPLEGVTVILVGLDNFGHINDAVGYERGDRVICEVVERLEALSSLWGARLLGVYRIGGDEFALLCSREASASDSPMEMAEAALAEVAEPLQLDGTPLRVRASAGVAVYPGVADTAESLLSGAEATLREAKTLGKGRTVLYDSERHSRREAEVQLHAELEAAVERREFFLVYQPKFRMADGVLIGVEALVRWRHPTRGDLPAGAFVGLAERLGLIGEIGALVLEEAVRQVSVWRAEGRPDIQVAVNVSQLQLRDVRFVGVLGSLLQFFRVPGHLLQVELTESAFAEDPELLHCFIASLRRLNVDIALDDFGQGFSSLAMLKDFDLDIIKVDKAFVDEIHTRRGLAVMRAIIELGHAMGMTLVAEGVESDEQVATLLALGCDAIQGYLYGKPMRPEELDWDAITTLAGLGSLAPLS